MFQHVSAPGRLRLFCLPLAPLLLFCLPALLHGNVLEDSRRALLVAALAERKIPFEIRPLFAEFGGFGSSIHVPLPASPAAGEQKPGVFILALPLSFTGDQGRDFPYAFETALDFIDRVRNGGLQTDALVAFLGDEWPAIRAGRNGSPPDQGAPLLGLRDLYSRLELPEDAALIYLDMCGETGEILVHHGARRTLAPLNILRPLTRLLDQGKVPYALAVNANELYKLGLADGPPALEFALGRESPALCLAGGAAGLAEDLGALLFDYARAVEPGTENPDYHYLIFSVAGRCFFVSEYATALIFIALASLFFFAALIYSVALRSRLAVQWKVFFGRSWILLLYWLMLVLALKAAALIFRGITRGADPARFGGSALLFYAAAAAQLLLGAALFMLLSLPGDCIHVPRRANFYGSSAIVLAIAEILLAAYIDITFIPVFVWSFVFVFLAACVRKPALICVCALLTFLHGGAVLLTLVQAGNRRLGFLIFSGDTAFMIYAALVSLPFFMAVKRGALLFARKTGKGTLPGELAKRPPKPGAIVGLLAPRLAAIALAAAALGTGAWFVARNPVPGPPRRTLVDEPESAGILAMNVVDRIFLERRTLNITLEAPPDPLRFNLYVDGVRRGETPPVYSAPMPFRSIESPGAPGRHSVEFILGEGPPNPFSTEIVLPADFVGVLRAEALYAERGSEGQLGVIRRYPVGQAP